MSRHFLLSAAARSLGIGKVMRMTAAAAPLALVIAPTRELALQVERELGWLYQYAATRIVSCGGGMDPRLERRKLVEGAHIAVGTPGRLRDHTGAGRRRRALIVDRSRADRPITH